METGARGFALTGAAPFLGPYESGRYAVALDLGALRKRIADPQQERLLGVLAGQAKTRLESARDLVAARQKSGAAPAVAELTHDKQLMDAARASVDRIEEGQKWLLEQRSRRARAARQWTGSAIALGSIFGVIFLSIAGITVSREIGVSARARSQIKTLNADLERRVEQRTAALQSEIAARTEIQGQLRASEERFEDMANGIPQLAWMAEADGTIFWYNQRWYEYTGTMFDQMQGWGLAERPPSRLSAPGDGWLEARDCRRAKPLEHGIPSARR